MIDDDDCDDDDDHATIVVEELDVHPVDDDMLEHIVFIPSARVSIPLG